MRALSNGRTAHVRQSRVTRLRSRVRPRQAQAQSVSLTLDDVAVSPANPPPGDFVTVSPVVTNTGGDGTIFGHIESPQFGEPVMVYCQSISAGETLELSPFLCIGVPGMCGSFTMPDGPVDLDVRVGPTVEGQHCSNAASWADHDSMSVTVEPDTGGGNGGGNGGNGGGVPTGLLIVGGLAVAGYVVTR